MGRSARVGCQGRVVSSCEPRARSDGDMNARGRRSRGRKRRKARGGPKGTKAQFIALNAGYSVFDIYAGHCILLADSLPVSRASGRQAGWIRTGQNSGTVAPIKSCHIEMITKLPKSQ